MEERGFFLERVWPPLYVFHHGAEGKRQGIALLLSPFAEEKKTAQRPLVEVARALARAGWEAVRFDFRGTGDSGGEFGEFHLDHWREDIRAVASWAREVLGPLPLGLVGVRLGGSLALERATELEARWVALWEPIVDGRNYMRQNFQRRRIRQLLTEAEGGKVPEEPKEEGTEDAFPAFDFDGFWVNATLHRQIATWNLVASTPPFLGRVWLVQVGARESLRPEMASLAERLREQGAQVEVAVYRLEPFWSRVDYVSTAPLREGLLTWLQRNSGGREG